MCDERVSFADQKLLAGYGRLWSHGKGWSRWYCADELYHRLEDINKSCLEEFRQHWTCLDNNNQQLWQCRPHERTLNACVFDKLVYQAISCCGAWLMILLLAEARKDDSGRASRRAARPSTATPNICPPLVTTGNICNGLKLRRVHIHRGVSYILYDEQHVRSPRSQPPTQGSTDFRVHEDKLKRQSRSQDHLPFISSYPYIAPTAII